MFTIDEKHLYPMGKPNPDTGMFPPPCHPHEPHHPPHHTLPETVEMLMAETRATCARLLEFERRLEHKYDDMTRHLTSDNVIFKNTFAEAHRQFAQEVKNEVNIFEGNMNAALALFQKTMESKINADLETQNQTIADAVSYMKDNLAAALGSELEEMEANGTLDDIIDAALNVHNVKHYGAKGDGVTNDAEAIFTAMSTVGKVYFPNGTYVIDGAEFSIPDNCVLEGESFKGVTLLFKNDATMKFQGTSILNSGTHRKHFNIRGIQFRSENNNVPMLQLICCDYVKIENCWFYGLGRQVLLWECFDSRFLNTDFEWGGTDGNLTVMGVELRSGDGGLGGNTYEYTNNIYFIGCRFESHQGICVGSTGSNTNKIVFTDCKFESFNVKNCNAVRFVKAVSVYFRDCFFVGVLNNTYNYVYLDQTEDIVLYGYGDHRTGTYSGKKLFYVSGSRNIDVCLNINANGAYTPTHLSGFDTYDETTREKMRIKVNSYRNDQYYVTNDDGAETVELTEVSQEISFGKNGFLIIKGAGNVTDGKGTIKFSTEYSNMSGDLTSYDCGWTSICIPVVAYERITITLSNIGEAYASFRPLGQKIY